MVLRSRPSTAGKFLRKSEPAASAHIRSSFVASTEIGTLVRLVPDPETMDKSEWDWFEISPHINGWLIPQEDQPGIFEPVVLVRVRFCL